MLGLDPEKVLPDFSSYPESDRLAMEAHSKLVIIAKAANQIDNDCKEWQPDWSNYDEYKAGTDPSDSETESSIFDGMNLGQTFGIVGGVAGIFVIGLIIYQKKV